MSSSKRSLSMRRHKLVAEGAGIDLVVPTVGRTVELERFLESVAAQNWHGTSPRRPRRSEPRRPARADRRRVSRSPHDSPRSLRAGDESCMQRRLPALHGGHRRSRGRRLLVPAGPARSRRTMHFEEHPEWARALWHVLRRVRVDRRSSDGTGREAIVTSGEHLPSNDWVHPLHAALASRVARRLGRVVWAATEQRRNDQWRIRGRRVRSPHPDDRSHDRLRAVDQNLPRATSAVHSRSTGRCARRTSTDVDHSRLLRQYGFPVRLGAWRSTQLIGASALFLVRGEPGRARFYAAMARGRMRGMLPGGERQAS